MRARRRRGCVSPTPARMPAWWCGCLPAPLPLPSRPPDVSPRPRQAKLRWLLPGPSPTPPPLMPLVPARACRRCGAALAREVARCCSAGLYLMCQVADDVGEAVVRGALEHAGLLGTAPGQVPPHRCVGRAPMAASSTPAQRLLLGDRLGRWSSGPWLPAALCRACIAACRVWALPRALPPPLATSRQAGGKLFSTCRHAWRPQAAVLQHAGRARPRLCGSWSRNCMWTHTRAPSPTCSAL